MKINLKIIFNITSTLLVLSAAGLVVHSGHEFWEANIIPLGQKRAKGGGCQT